MKPLLSLLVFLLSLSTQVLANDSKIWSLPDYKASYRVEKSGVTLGRAHFILKRQDNNLHYRSKTQPTGWLAMVRPEEVFEESQVLFSPEQGFRSLSYRYLQKNREKSKLTQFDFDWKTLLAKGIHKQHKKQITLDHNAPLYDRLSLQLLLINKLNNQQDIPKQIHVLDNGKQRLFSITDLGRENVLTALGKLETRKIRFQRDEKRATTLWLAPSLHHLIVHFQQREKNSLIDVPIVDVEWKTNPNQE